MRYGIVELTEANLEHKHIYLSSIYDLFPMSVKGGGSWATAATDRVELHHGVGAPSMTDIDGEKKFFRTRDWQDAFFAAHGLRPGDRVVVEHTGGLRYHIYPLRTL